MVIALNAFAAEEPIPALRPPRDQLRPSFWEQQGWLILIGIIVVAGAVVFLLKWRQRKQPVTVVPPEILARSALEALRGRPEDSELVAEVSRIIRHYVITAFHLPPDELTTTELQNALSSHSGIDPDLTKDVSHFLRRCDEWKFAPVPSTPALQAVIGALALIDKIEAGRKPAPQPLQPQPP